MANVVKTLLTDFYQNQPRLVEDYDKSMLTDFFLGHGVYLDTLLLCYLSDYGTNHTVLVCVASG